MPAAGDLRVRVHSEAMGEMAEFSLEGEIEKAGPGWGLDGGGAEALRRRGLLRHRMDTVVASDVPVGAGLSSSAALEVAMGLALLAVNGAEMDRVELALACQWAEHNYAGMPCGIMDQFISALGERGRALLLDCRDRTVRQVAMDGDGVRVVVANSGVKHALVGGEYGARRRQCAEAVAGLGRKFPAVRSLRDATMEMLEAARGGMDQTVYRRARHVITENARTVAFAGALERGDFAECGALMYGSHASLRDDYEVSCAELDVLVEIVRGAAGVYGARDDGRRVWGVRCGAGAGGGGGRIGAGDRGGVFSADGAADGGVCDEGTGGREGRERGRLAKETYLYEISQPYTPALCRRHCGSPASPRISHGRGVPARADFHQ